MHDETSRGSVVDAGLSSRSMRSGRHVRWTPTPPASVFAVGDVPGRDTNLGVRIRITCTGRPDLSTSALVRLGES